MRKLLKSPVLRLAFLYANLDAQQVQLIHNGEALDWDRTGTELGLHDEVRLHLKDSRVSTGV